MSKCELFQEIAKQVWDNISRNMNRNNRVAELTTTDIIIDRIQTYVEERHSFEVFVQKALNEVKTGADIELYIQTSFNQFIRIMLQAKTVELDGDFKNIDRNSGSTGRKQYDSLIDFGIKVNSLSFYLFYNGIPNYHRAYNDCAGVHDEKQFGCALLSAIEVKTHCEENNTGTISGSDLLKPLGVPWRFLTCCENSIENQQNYKRYTWEEIDMDPYFNNLFTTPPPIGFVIKGQQPRTNTLEMLNINIHKLGWNPAARIIVGQKKMYLRDGFLNQRW